MVVQGSISNKKSDNYSAFSSHLGLLKKKKIDRTLKIPAGGFAKRPPQECVSSSETTQSLRRNDH